MPDHNHSLHMKHRDKQNIGITIFFPAYNDAGTIASMAIVATLTVRDITDDYEIIIVNDGSKDGTEEVLKELETLYPHVRFISHSENIGYGGALKTGFACARKELIFYTDGDAQYDPRELKLLWSKLTDDVDMVNGYKINRCDPFYRALIGRSYHRLAKILFGLHIRDVDCDFRLIRKKVFDKVKLDMDSGVICVELVRKIQDAGFKTVEAPVHHYHRSYGGSQFFKIKNIYKALKDLLILWRRLVLNERFSKSKNG